MPGFTPGIHVLVGLLKSLWRAPALAATPYIAFTISRSLNFCSLPVEVFGISANKM